MSTNVFVGISACSHGAVTITDVVSIDVSESGDKLEHFVDAHRYPSWADEFGMKMRIAVNVKTLPENFVIARGTSASLSFTGKNKDGGSDKTVTCSKARFLHYAPSTIHHKDEAAGALVFAAVSSDGDTSPLGTD
jgi:hypothetical protein